MKALLLFVLLLTACIAKPQPTPIPTLVDNFGKPYTITLPQGFQLLSWEVSKRADELYRYNFSFQIPKGKRIESGTLVIRYYDEQDKELAMMIFVSIGDKDAHDFEKGTVTTSGVCGGVKCLAIERGARYTILVDANLIDWP